MPPILDPSEIKVIHLNKPHIQLKPHVYQIAVIPGDGIGVEVIAAGKPSVLAFRPSLHPNLSIG